MAASTRQSNLFAAEDWKKVYETFREADFQSYDYETIRKSMVDYLRNYYPEDFNDFIESIPDKYQTIVGERGLKLSGGEKQRIAIARTVLKNPSIFFFDEATSALDSSTEKDIIENLNNISEGKTTLIIAHRLSTVSKADNIIVIDKGKIVEEGNHPTLIAKKGLYSSMWDKQKDLN